MSALWLKLLELVGGLLIKWGIKKKQISDAERADAAEKAVESVGESLEVEKKVREEQDKTEKKPTDVEEDDGGLNFDEFNKGE